MADFAPVVYSLYYLKQNSWKGRFTDQRLCSFILLISIATLLSRQVASVQFSSKVYHDACFHHPFAKWVLQNVSIFANLIGEKVFLIVALCRVSLIFSEITLCFNFCFKYNKSYSFYHLQASSHHIIKMNLAIVSELVIA